MEQQRDRRQRELVRSVLPGLILLLTALAALSAFGLPRDVSIDWTAASAVLQALSGVAIVVLTVILAAIARNALGASRKQVEVSAVAAREARRDTHIASAPRLTLVRPELVLTTTAGPTFVIHLKVVNGSDVPALDIRVELAKSSETGVRMENPRVEDWVGGLEPDTDATTAIDMHPFKNVPNPTVRRPPREAPFAVDHIAVDARYRGPLGQEIIDTWLWVANFEDQGDSRVWRLASRWVKPNVEDTEPLSMQFTLQ